MDAFAVAIATGISLGSVNIRQNFRLAWHFGFFQAAMPVIGWAAGLTIRSTVTSFDYWLAFGLLIYVSQGMLRQAFSHPDTCKPVQDPTKGLTMVMLSFATSLDALAVGFSLSMLEVSIWVPALVIGVVAATFTTLGMHLGKKVSRCGPLKRCADALGAFVLAAIAVNILRENGVFSQLF